jgi:MoaE-MoaD fusion protein
VEIDVRVFAVLRERLGADRLTLALESGATVADALEALREVDGIGGTIALLPVVMAVNREYAPPETVLEEGDELALIPPVSGGAKDVHARVTGEPLSLEGLTRMIASPHAGAVVTFQGVTREVERLDYEAYAEMATETMLRILSECLERHGALAAAAEHRTGAVPLGEPSVIVAVSAAHRREAFAAAREAIDRIKVEAPIWKREVQAGASDWVAGAVPAPAAPPAGHGAA